MNEIQSTAAQQGTVISYFGNSVAVEGENGQVFQCHLKRNQDLPVVGDEVMWQLEGETGIILSILPRKSVLSKGDARGKTKPLAANVDYIVIVMAPPPIFSEYLVDRYLVAAELLGIKAILVINKSDLLSQEASQSLGLQLSSYEAIPYPVILTSVLTGAGLDSLNAYLKDKTAVLVGPSGVGKSSIIAALSAQDIRVNDVSPKGAGKHTTTATRLYHLPSGGRLIDSPGVREFTLWPVTEAEILKGFKEFTKDKAECRFRDCKHRAEPGCAVQKAVEDGKISPQRFENYLELMKNAYKEKY